jgi:ribosomal protein S20
LAKTPRKWTGARSPSGLKRVRSSARRHAILEPRRSAAKTLVRAALAAVTSPTPGTDSEDALRKAASALDRAAKVGAIHRNQAARRKSRLAIKVFDAQAGAGAVTGQATRTVSKAQAQKAAKARIAAGKADKAKGAQTAAGKARAALHRTTRGEAAEAPAKAPPTATAAPAAKAAKPAAKAGKPAAKAASKTTVVGATGGEAKPASKAQSSKAGATKAPATKVDAAKPAPKKAAKR